jgi:hypothetical protein
MLLDQNFLQGVVRNTHQIATIVIGRTAQTFSVLLAHLEIPFRYMDLVLISVSAIDVLATMQPIKAIRVSLVVVCMWGPRWVCAESDFLTHQFILKEFLVYLPP